MRPADDLPTRLRQHYRSEADLYVADGQLGAVLARTRAIHPRPSWRGLQSGSGTGASLWWVLRQPRVAWATLAILTALLMVAAAIIGQRPDRPPDGSSQAIFVRGYEELEVVVVRVDGQERSLGLVPESVAGPRGQTIQQFKQPHVTEPFVVSPTGRLAVGRGVTSGLEWAFFTLGDSNAVPVKVLQDQRRSGPSGTWDTDGHFIAGREEAAEWIDSATGATERRLALAARATWRNPARRGIRLDGSVPSVDLPGGGGGGGGGRIRGWRSDGSSISRRALCDGRGSKARDMQVRPRSDVPRPRATE